MLDLVTGLAGPVQSRWLAIRDRLLESRRFQDFSIRFPLTRPIARAHVRKLFGLCAGFVNSQVLYACVQTGLLERLAQRPFGARELASLLTLEAQPLDTLMRAACALKLLRHDHDDGNGAVYSLGAVGAMLLGNPGVLAMIRHHGLLYADLVDPLAWLRPGARPVGQLARYWSYARHGEPGSLAPSGVQAYSDLMAESQQMISTLVLAAYPFERHRHLLDIGGGSGAFLSAIGRAVPGLSLSLFDLPPVVQASKSRLDSGPLKGRVRVHAGSFLSDELPPGADIATLVRVVHDHDDPVVRDLLRAALRALSPGGTLLIAEPMTSRLGRDPITETYFGMYLLVMGSGRPRTILQIKQMLAQAGFVSIRRHSTRVPELVQVVSGRKPK